MGQSLSSYGINCAGPLDCSTIENPCATKPYQPRQPQFEIGGGIYSLEDSNKVNQIKRFYLGDTMVTLGNPPDQQVLRRQKELRNGQGCYEEEITEKFGMDFKNVAEGHSDNWYDDTDGVLAIILMF